MPRLFNGSSDFIGVVKNPNNAGGIDVVRWNVGIEFSFSGWINGPSGVVSLRAIWALGSDTTSGPLFGASVSADRFQWFARHNDAGAPLDLNTSSTAVVMDSKWHHVGFTVDASLNYVMYVDGVVDHSGSWSQSTTDLAGSASATATIGALSRSLGRLDFFTGSIAHIAEWGRILSRGEMLALFLGTSPLYLQASHYFPLNEGSGSVLALDYAQQHRYPGVPAGTVASVDDPTVMRKPLPFPRRMVGLRIPGLHIGQAAGIAAA